MKVKRPPFWWTTGLVAALFLTIGPGSAFASVLVPQTHYPGIFVDKYQAELPIFNGFRVDAATTPSQTVTYREFRQRILPDSFYVFSPTVPSFDGTLLWGYDIDGDGLNLVPGSSDPARFVPNTGVLYPGNTFLVERGTPTFFTYQNELPRGINLPNPANNQDNYLQRLLSIDQTIHFANPFEIDITNFEQTGNPYLGPQPTVTHLHGGEDQSTSDGTPDQWFTPLQDPADDMSALQGAGYYTYNSALPSNEAEFMYPNDQEATTLWYHDHSLGITRINVYAGLAGYYWLRDTGTLDDGIAGANKLPANQYELEFVIQDRMFDDTGELLFPDGLPFFIPQPPHLFWNPEFLGDVNVVNGKSWPFVSVEARRYRVRFLNGCNARFYNLYFKGQNSPKIWVIGTDGGLLNAPVEVSQLLIAPGERYDTIIEFGNNANSTFVLQNNAKAPFPFGDNPPKNTIGQVAEFRVGAAPGADNSWNPAMPPSPLRTTAIEELPGVEIPGSGTATDAPVIDGTNVQRVRMLTLNENLGAFGPIEALLNNTKWSGRIEGFGAPIPVSVGNLNELTLDNGTNSAPVTYYPHELPQVGSTEIWQIVNLTGDAHPIHLHLVQFQILNRQEFNTKQYDAEYLRAFGVSNFFPKGQYKPAFGPPRPYNDFPEDPMNPGTNATYPGTTIPIIGGNPDINNFLKGSPSLPEPYERGWKDTVVVPPKQVTTIVVRWTPQDQPFNPADAGNNHYSFDPSFGPGYVWHCHILDHEDNEMMRPYLVLTGAGSDTNIGSVLYNSLTP